MYEYLKVSPVTSIPITAEHLNLSYNSVSKAFATLKKYNTKNEFLNSTAQWGDGIHSRTVDIYSFI